MKTLEDAYYRASETFRVNQSRVAQEALDKAPAELDLALTELVDKQLRHT